MTKAKTKSRRVWLGLHPYLPDPVLRWDRKSLDRMIDWYDRNDTPGVIAVPATLTWTPPAKAKKRSAKR